MKWVCLLLILTNFSFDLLLGSYSKKPIATGTIIESKLSGKENLPILILKIDSGRPHEGEFFWTEHYTGSILSIISEDVKSKTLTVELDKNPPDLPPGTKFNSYSTIQLSNILLLIELTLIFYIFHLILGKKPLLSKLTIAVIIFSISLWIFRNIILEKIYSYGGFYNGVTTLIIIVFSLAFFYLQLSTIDDLFIYSNPTFWVVVAILIYKVGTFFLFLYTNSLSQDEKASFYVFNSLFYLLQNLFLAVAFMIPGKQALLKSNKLSIKKN